MVIIHRLLAEIIRIVYWLVTQVLVLIGNLSKYNLFGEIDIVKSFTTRVYIIIGVLMLFKLVISAVQYLVNPDMLEDKSKGASALLQRTILAVALLVLVPYIFEFAIDIQDTVVSAIPRIVFGQDQRIQGYTDGNGGLNFNSAADEISFNVVAGFLKLKTQSADEVSSIGKDDIGIIWDIPKVLNEGCGGVFDDTNAEKCKYDTGFMFLSIPVGLYLIFIFGSMAVDIGIRAVKFGIIQILAPVPIANYITDEKRLSEWSKTAVQVYIDLFIRMFVVYFVIEIILLFLASFVGDSGVPGISGIQLVIVKIAIIISICLFAKNAPKFICDLLGIKGADESIGKMFKRAGGMLGASAAGLTAAHANYQNKLAGVKKNWNENTSIGQKLKDRLKTRATSAPSSFAGMTSALSRGTFGALNGKGMKEAFNRGHKGAVTARQNRDLDNLNDIGMMERARARYQDFMGIDTDESLAENKQKAYSTVHQDVGSYKKAVMGRIDKNQSVAMRADVKAGSAIDQLGQLLNANRTTIMNGSNADLKNILNKFTLQTYIDKNGNTRQAYTLKTGEHVGYYDLEAVRINAEQEHIGSISSKMEPLKTIAQKELFSDAMYGRVEDISGNLIDEINFGNREYVKRGIVRQGKTHSDITTAVQTAQQHIAENAVALGDNAELLQQWFTGTVDVTKHPGYEGDFGNLDDKYQRESQDLSQAMSTSKAHLARESVKRRDANKEKK